jgi:hypothetical protein
MAQACISEIELPHHDRPAILLLGKVQQRCERGADTAGTSRSAQTRLT